MPKQAGSMGVFRGYRVFFHLLERQMIVPLRTVIVVDEERYIVDGDGNLTPLELTHLSFHPKGVLDEKNWDVEVEIEDKEGGV